MKTRAEENAKGLREDLAEEIRAEQEKRDLRLSAKRKEVQEKKKKIREEIQEDEDLKRKNFRETG